MPRANAHVSHLIDIVRKHTHSLDPISTGMATATTNSGAPIQTVLFDVYGTLLISGSGDVGSAQLRGGADAFVRALSSFSDSRKIRNAPAAGEVAQSCYFEEIESDHAAKIEAGTDFPEVDIRDIWRAVWARLENAELVDDGGIDDETLEELALYYEVFSNPTYPMPGCRTTVERLRDAGLRLGLVSNAQFFTPLLFPAQLGATLEELGFDKGLILWSYQELVAKPSREVFRRLMERVSDFAPESTLYVGNDMLNDISAAVGVGIRTCLFAGDRRSLRLRSDEERCAGVEADFVIDALDQLLEIVKVS